ncbi:sulfatase-like hydrolase/transferase [Flavobacteriaceae bacterium LMO-SS05]
MKFSLQAEAIYKYVHLIIGLIVTFWLMSLFELIMLKSEETNVMLAVVLKLTNDFWSGLIIGLLLFPVFVLCQIVLKNAAIGILKVLVVMLVLIQFSLVIYSLTTLVNLGADLLGYSLNDISATITSSVSFSILYFLPFIVFLLVFLFAQKLISNFLNERNLIGIGVVFILIFGSLKLVLPGLEDSKYQNKLAFLTNDILKHQNEKRKLKAFTNNRTDYPLLKPFSKTKDVLSPFFNIPVEKPNIVILIVEGLGSEFIGDNAYSGFTPFLDSLRLKSLYWENFVSNSGRTFGVVPSLLGSLPYGDSGFLELPNTPSHLSIASVLKANGYKTAYYSGDQASFDKKINFLEYNDFDQIVDENNYGRDYVKTESNSEGFSWGYPDSEIFKKTLASSDPSIQPRLDVIMTLSNHEPFLVPSKELFELKVDSILNSTRRFNIPKEEILEHKNIYTSLYYTDKSIQDFMHAYSKRSDYKNTIFIITGDHRLIPIAQKDKLCRFHVPLYIFSPMLKKPQKFKSISSHWDVTPSLLSFLINNYRFSALETVAWMGDGLDTAKQFRNIHKIPLTRYKGSINDFIYKDYLYSDGELYKIKDNFGTYKVQEEELSKSIADSLMAFKMINAYVTQNNKIFPDSLNMYVKHKAEFTKAQLAEIDALTQGLNFDQIFLVAQKKGHAKEYKKARLLCDYILNELPNHADARTLKGRTLAWEGDYKNAETELLAVIKWAPYYYDSYLALFDLYWWSNQDEKSEGIFKLALKNNLVDPDISFKMAKAYSRMHNTEQAKTLMDSILKTNLDNSDYLTFKQTLQ